MGSLKGKKVLITCGPTWVAVDPVRVISNISSGELGQGIARHLKNSGCHVTVLEGTVTNPLSQKGITVKKFRYFGELAELLQKELKTQYNAVIHAAAVSDFKPRAIIMKKINSDRKNFNLKLTRTPKIINRIKKAAPKTFLVGFKLEPKMNPSLAKKETQKLVASADCDLVVANTTQGPAYHAFILDKESRILTHVNSRIKLAAALAKVLQKQL